VVGEAADGTTGLTETRRLSPDVVLLDVLLPDVSGLEVARKLAPCPSTRVVLTSSRGAEELGVAPDLPGVIRVDPLTGAQEVFASGPPFVNPLGLAFETSGDLIVTDGFDGNSILRVDRDLATIAVLSTGLPYLIDPSGVGIAVHAS